MRWERLFADLGAQADALEVDDRDQLVEELVDETWASLRWRDLLGGAVTLDVIGQGHVSGHVSLVNDHVICLTSDTSDVVIHPQAVLAVVDAEHRADPVGLVDRRLGWVRIWRSMRDAGQEVTVTRLDGSRVRGLVERVGGDFVMILAGPRHTMVCNSAVAMVSDLR